MSDDVPEDDVRRLLEEDLASSPTEHPWRTPNCLSTLKFLPAVAVKAWSREETSHVESCRYCQRMLGIAWRVTCPSPAVIARYALDPATSGVAAAMALHVEHDRCERCNRLLTSKAFARYVASRRAWHVIRERVVRLLDSESFGRFLAEIPALAADPSRVMLGGFVDASASAGPAERHRERAAMSDSGLELESDLDDRGNIVARAVTKDAALAGRRVWLALTTPDRTMTATTPLVARGRSYVAETNFALEDAPDDYILEGILLPERSGRSAEAGLASTPQVARGEFTLDGVLLPAEAPNTSAVIDALAAALRNEDADIREAAAHAIAALAKERDDPERTDVERTAERTKPAERRGEPDAPR